MSPAKPILWRCTQCGEWDTVMHDYAGGLVCAECQEKGERPKRKRARRYQPIRKPRTRISGSCATKPEKQADLSTAQELSA